MPYHPLTVVIELEIISIDMLYLCVAVSYCGVAEHLCHWKFVISIFYIKPNYSHFLKTQKQLKKKEVEAAFNYSSLEA